MREFLFWASVLLALPACGDIIGIEPWDPQGGEAPMADPGFNLVQGSLPRDGVVFCDIVKARRCALPSDIAMGTPLTEAAVALNLGKGDNQVKLDYSKEAVDRCLAQTGVAVPEAIVYWGNFPQGWPVCLNCSEVLGPGKTYPDANAACQAACHDFFLNPPNGNGDALPVKPPTQATIDYCAANAAVSTNMALDACIPGGCDNAGTFLPFFEDPRRATEPVAWTDLIEAGISGVDGNNLFRSTGAPDAWDAGAVSTQWITKGDAFVEFSMSAGGSGIVGLSEVPNGCMKPGDCPDADATDDSVKFGILVRYDGAYFVTEAGALLPGPGLDGSFGSSAPGDRFRVYVRHETDGTRSVRYTKLAAPCIAGAPCNETIFYISTGVTLTYPLRVDSSLFHDGVVANDVRVMRIR